MPERASAPLKLTVTFVLFQPPALAAGNREGVTVGGVLSRLIASVTVTALPPISRAVPDTVCFAPSVVTGTGKEHEVTRIPEQAKLTVTFVLFQPAAFGALSGLAVMASGALPRARSL